MSVDLCEVVSPKWATGVYLYSSRDGREEVVRVPIGSRVLRLDPSPSLGERMLRGVLLVEVLVPASGVRGWMARQYLVEV